MAKNARIWAFPLLASAMLATLAGCADPKEAVISQACMKFGTQGDLSETRCDCVAATARKYLSPHDYDLLAGVASIYVSNDDETVKTKKLINGLVDSGLTFPQAIGVTMNFMLAAPRIDAECGKASNNGTA